MTSSRIEEVILEEPQAQTVQAEQGERRSTLVDKAVYATAFLTAFGGGLWLLNKYGAHDQGDVKKKLTENSAHVQHIENGLAAYEQQLNAAKEENQTAVSGLHQRIAELQQELNNQIGNLEEHMQISLKKHAEDEYVALKSYENNLDNINNTLGQYQKQLQESSGLSLKRLEEISSKLAQYRAEMQGYGSEFRQHASTPHSVQTAKPKEPDKKPAKAEPVAPSQKPKLDIKPAEPKQPAPKQQENYLKPEEFVIGSQEKYGWIKGKQVVVKRVKAYQLDLQNIQESSPIYAVPIEEIDFSRMASGAIYEFAVLREKDLDPENEVMRPRAILKTNLSQYSFREKGRVLVLPNNLEKILDAKN